MKDTNQPNLIDEIDSKRWNRGEPSDLTQDESVIGSLLVIPEPSKRLLNDSMKIAYWHHRKRLLKRILREGKKGDTDEQYSITTLRRRMHDIDKFYRYVWREFDDHVYGIAKPEYANSYLRELEDSDYSQSHKINVYNSLRMLYKHLDIDWDPEIKFEGEHWNYQPTNYLTVDERRAIRNAAQEWSSVPAYHGLSPDQRDRWKHYIADQLDKLVSEVAVADFERVSGTKYTSLVWTSLDTGLSPAEVGEARIHWVDLDNRMLHVPADKKTDKQEHWGVALRAETAKCLEQWLYERELYNVYEDDDHLWLTRHGNPYGSEALGYVVDKLCDMAGIDTKDRKITWYSIRHSLGVHMAREKGLSATQAQLRHNTPETTLRYLQSPVEERRDSLDRIG